MAIRFQCKECDAQFSVEDSLAGKAAKCPKCKAIFEVPSPNTASTEGDVPSQIISGASEEAPPSEAEEGGATEASTDTIVFLCPNGHELHGPASLQGKGGKCPHCGSTFQIPVYDDEEEEEIEKFPGIEINPDEESEVEEVEAISDDNIEIEEEGEIYPPPLPGEIHPLSHHFSWLWNQREHGAKLALHFKNGGEPLYPGLYAARRSQGPYGLFAVEEEDGTFTLTTIAWDEIARITLSKAEDIDDDAFDLD